MKRSAQLIAFLFLFLFSYTAISKLLTLGQFRDVLAVSPAIGPAAVWLAPSIPVIELLICGLLFFPATRRRGLLASVLLMATFTFYVGWMMMFTPHLPCSCGGIIALLGWKWHLVLNVVLTVLAARAWWPRPEYSRTRPVYHP